MPTTDYSDNDVVAEQEERYDDLIKDGWSHEDAVMIIRGRKRVHMDEHETRMDAEWDRDIEF